jgi:Tfp pilus assembly protein FimT
MKRTTLSGFFLSLVLALALPAGAQATSTVRNSAKTERNASESQGALTTALRQQSCASVVISSNSVDAQRPPKSGDSRKVFRESSSHPRNPRTLFTRNN